MVEYGVNNFSEWVLIHEIIRPKDKRSVLIAHHFFELSPITYPRPDLIDEFISTLQYQIPGTLLRQPSLI